MTKKIQKHLLNQYIQDDIAPWLFKLQEQYVEITVYVYVTIFGFEVNYRKEIGGAENWKREDENLEPVQTLHRRTSFINAEAVRKLFEAKNYSEMICRIKERFQGPTAYDDLLNYLSENRIIEIS